MTNTSSTTSSARTATLSVYIGTYTGPQSKGIYLFRMDMAGGALTPLGAVGEVANPSFVAIAPSRRFLYAANEVSDFAGQNSGAISSFSVDASTGRLQLLNQQPSGGSGPCHVSTDASGRYILSSNYGSGSVAVLTAGEDGRLGVPVCVVQHRGSGPDPKRQAGPHVHSAQFDPSGRFVLVADLGLDKVMIYRFNAATGQLTPNDPPAATTRPGAGPRHLAFAPGGRFVYVASEMGSLVTAFAYDGDTGRLSEVQTLSTLPQDFHAANTASEIAMLPTGRFLYVSNRGHDSIATFRVDAQSGRLALVGHVSTQGKNPRGFGIDPSGAFLVAANQASDNLVVFRLDAATGLPHSVGAVGKVASPVCVKFLQHA
jgi:6-phosphogluconolactonase